MTTPTRPQPVDAQALRRALGLFATGVTIVTARDADGQALGMTANSFSSVSLDPPIVLWSIRKASNAHAAFAEAEHFAINVLGAAQSAVANRYASRDQERFRDEAWRDGVGAVPVLDDALASFECRRIACVDMGDHSVIFGAVEAARTATDSAPLVFYRGRYARACGDLAAQCEMAA